MQREDLVLKKLKLLKPFIGGKAEKIWLFYNASNPMDRRAWEVKIDILAAKYLQTFQEENLLEPIPAEYCSGEVYLGEVSFLNQSLYPFYLEKDFLLKHAGIFSQTGSGKSNLAMLIAMQLLKQGIPFIAFDIKRNFRELKALRGPAKELEVFTAGREVKPLRINLLRPPFGMPQKVWNKKLLDIMEDIFFFGRGCSHVLREKLERTQDIREALTLLKHERMKAGGRKGLWLDSGIARLDDLSTIADIINAKEGTKIEELLKKQVVIELDALSATERAFITEGILCWVYHYRLYQPEREQVKQILIIEEAQNIFRERRNKLESFTETMFRQSRELGIGLIYIAQNASRIPVTILQNTFTNICFNQNHRKDIDACAWVLLLDLKEREILSRLEVGKAVMRMSGKYTKPFMLAVPLVPIVKGMMTDEELKCRFDESMPVS
jgi:hypothetical protein